MQVWREEPDFDFDPEFSKLVATIFPKYLESEYEEFFFEEDNEEGDFVNSACLYALKKSEKHVLIKDVCGIVCLSTLNDWMKLGWLTSYKIAKRVLYRSDEVEASLYKRKYYRG